MAGTVCLDERLSVRERLLIVWRWICFTHAGSCCGGGVPLTSLFAFWCCPGCAILWALFLDFRWIVGRKRMDMDDAIVGVFWTLPSGPASSPLSILNAHFQL